MIGLGARRQLLLSPPRELLAMLAVLTMAMPKHALRRTMRMCICSRDEIDMLI